MDGSAPGQLVQVSAQTCSPGPVLPGRASSTRFKIEKYYFFFFLKMLCQQRQRCSSFVTLLFN
jgi:hypothetical protein